MKSFTKILLVLCFTLIGFSCDVAKNVAETYNLTQCKYKYSSISSLNLAGVSLQNVNSLSSLNPLTLANLVAAFSKSSIPLEFTLNLDVTNPNYQPALLNKMQYILEIDNVEMTTGGIDYKMQIAPGQIAQLPLNISFDLKKAMKGETADAIKNMAFNFAGLGDKPTNVTIKLKPTLDIGGQPFLSPMYIPVSFTYGKNSK